MTKKMMMIYISGWNDSQSIVYTTRIWSTVCQHNHYTGNSTSGTR